MRQTTAILLAFVLATYWTPAGAQQVGQNATTPSTGATFQATSQLVIETVGVKGKDGKPVEGLTSKDFVVTEDGAPQTIKFFEYQKLPDASDPASTLPPITQITPMAKLPHTQIEPEKPGDLHYRDRRLLGLYFDMSAMSQAESTNRVFHFSEPFTRPALLELKSVIPVRNASGFAGSYTLQASAPGAPPAT